MIPLAVSVGEAAQLLGLSRSSAYLAVQRGEIPSVLIGHRIIIPMKRLEALLEGGSCQEVVRVQLGHAPEVHDGSTRQGASDECRESPEIQARDTTRLLIDSRHGDASATTEASHVTPSGSYVEGGRDEL